MSDQRISYLPTPGLSYDPAEEKYWDQGGLDADWPTIGRMLRDSYRDLRAQLAAN